MRPTFRKLALRDSSLPRVKGQVFLSPTNWDDYSFKTSFEVSLMGREGEIIRLGTVKIGYKGQKPSWTLESIPDEFDALPSNFFSLGQDVSFYKNLHDLVDDETRSNILVGLRDVAGNEDILADVLEERVFDNSLTRGVKLSTVRDQFHRVLAGMPALTDFEFLYDQLAHEKSADISLKFSVKASSKPSTNIHVLIGRNGIGKTTILNNMVLGLVGQEVANDSPAGRFYQEDVIFNKTLLPSDYFSSVVSVSFSAFDPFSPPEDRSKHSGLPDFIYVGMKNSRRGGRNASDYPPKSSADFVSDFVSSFRSCMSQPEKKNRWIQAMRRLSSDENFADMGLTSIVERDVNLASRNAGEYASRLSSGHAIVLLTITRLVDTVQEKTLVLIDEPESHLHPPLLSAFTRALSDLLHDRNGVAIIATHSPVLLQEVPKSCVWKITRIRSHARCDRPERETFGENVGVLTREVFGLEVEKSGFHELLQNSVDQGGSYEEIIGEYGGQLGAEAKAILISLIASRDSHLRGEDL